ncbi:MAG: hypothetical protein NT007_13735 [Candidatus Kapabacteria bacterium]|nr:hypothetical protein [Candidatus Kapabacteria bacterium]
MGSEIIKKHEGLTEADLKIRVQEKTLDNPNLKKLKANRAYLQDKVKTEIKFDNAILSYGNLPIIFPNTINVIQGQYGSHKSRFVEMILAAFLNSKQPESELCNFHSDPEIRFLCSYIDSERNLKDQLPYSMQKINSMAGYCISDLHPALDFTSLLNVKREERFDALKDYIEDLRKLNTGYQHFIIVVDVVTDIISNFNNPEESLKLIDHFNELINANDITIIAIIHENPSSEQKARGHLGTELMNKASTQIKIELISDLVKVSNLKSRKTKKFSPIFLKYDDTLKELVLANDDEVKSANVQKIHKAGIDEVIDFIKPILRKGCQTQNDLVGKLMAEFNCSDRTASDRLKEIEKNKISLEIEGEIFLLYSLTTDRIKHYDLKSDSK